jgi:cytochrome bd ubiquinol oxidase subunit I
MHAACMWVVHVGTLLSAYFILAANSWMQNPVGYEFNPETGRAELHDFWAVLTNKVQMVTFPHTITAAYMTGGAFVLGIAFYLYRRGSTPDADRPMYRTAVKVGAIVAMVGGLGVAVSGDLQGKIMTEVQPMKMAAAEALYETEQPAAFSVLTIGSLDGSEEVFSIKIPGLLSYLGTGSVDGEVQGVNPLSEQYQQEYGDDPDSTAYAAGDYTPVIPVTYWSFRLMIGLGVLAALGAAALLWITRRGRIPTRRVWLWLALTLPLMPVAANSFGWIFTEMGRQPWVVFGLMTTPNAVSPGVGAGEVLTSVITFTLLYGVLAVIEIGLMLHYIKRGADPFEEPPDPKLGETDDKPLAFAY